MIALTVVYAICFTLCAIFHLSSLFGVYYPPREATLFLQIGLVVLFVFSSEVVRRVRKNTNTRVFNQVTWNAIPGWLKICAGLTIWYALVGLCLSFAGDFLPNAFVIHRGGIPPDSVIALSSEIEAGYSRSFPAYWAALYLLMFCKSYSDQNAEKRAVADRRDLP
jgi:hypothetical protein